MSINVQEVKPLHLFSEASHYVCIGEPEGDLIPFRHLEGNTEVKLGTKYVEQFLKTADQFTKVVTVGKEDKHWTERQVQELGKGPDAMPEVGEVRVKGIRTIWEEIHSSQVFTVCFVKQGKPLSKKKYQELRLQQAQATLIQLNNAKSAPTRDAAWAGIIANLQDNPISEYEPGEERTLRGYKVQFHSRDGRYNCIDIDLPSSDPAKQIRPVNINTIKWLVWDGVKYEVE